MITYNGKAVTNPFLQALCLVAIAAGMFWMVLWLILVPFGIALAITIHPVLRALGRRGCIAHSGKSLTIELDRESFKKI